MRTAVVLLAALAACKGKTNDPPKETREGHVPPHPMPEQPPAPVPGDWAACKAALEAVPKLPPNRQVAALIEGCKPCGDWTPLLQWNTPTEDGGPKRQAIMDAMLGCKAWCDPNAKQRFLGTLDDARGKPTNRTPWRMLGEVCKDAVSAAPDPRFLSAPYFALDRIARDVAARPDGAPLLAALDLPLPAVSLTGQGLVLPESGVTKPVTGGSQLTITAEDVRIGPLPRAKLGANGITVSAGEPYPGNPVALAALGAALDKLPQPVVIFAPKALPAARLAEVLAAAKPRPLYLALAMTSPLPGWPIYGMSPVELVGAVISGGKPTATYQVGESGDEILKQIAPTAVTSPVAIAVQPTATVQAVATVLGGLGFKDVKTAVVTVAKPSKP
jgi:hypothetical protein